MAYVEGAKAMPTLSRLTSGVRRNLSTPNVEDELRDWIIEMHGHTSRIQDAIGDGRFDDSWRLVHAFQEWCVERINAERYGARAALTLLSVPQHFFAKILRAEGKYRQALAHTIYEGVLDGRDLKAHPKNIKAIFKKCGFEVTSTAEALAYYDQLKRLPVQEDQDFKAILLKVEEWN